MAEVMNFEKEILSTGIWNGIKFEEADLDSILDTYKELDGYLKIPLKLGHSDKQKLLQEDGYPSAGWITGLKKQGNKLIAVLSDVPKKIAEMINNKSYRDVSVELFKNWKEPNKGKVYKWTLRALSILGADAPAVKGLGDFQALYNSDEIKDNLFIFQYKQESSTAVQDGVLKQKEKEHKMSEELKQKLSAKEGEITKLSASNESLETELIALKAEQKSRDIDIFLSEFSKEENMKILPAQKGLYKELLKSFDETKFSFTEDEKEVKMSAKEILEKILQSMPKLVKMEEDAKNIKPKVAKKVDSEGKPFSESSLELESFAEVIMEEEKCDFDEAMRKASKIHPELV
jgi:hypothetical protein